MDRVVLLGLQKTVVKTKVERGVDDLPNATDSAHGQQLACARTDLAPDASGSPGFVSFGVAVF